MDDQTRTEMSHWRRECYRTLRDAGLEDVPDTFTDRAQRVLAAAGWIFGIAVLAVVMYW